MFPNRYFIENNKLLIIVPISDSNIKWNSEDMLHCILDYKGFKMFVCLFDWGLTPLSTIFQS